MPELPEVEVVRVGLERHVVGRTIGTVRVLHPRAVRRHVAGAAEFEAALAGRSLDGAGAAASTCGFPWARTPCSRTWA